ncbi:DUF4124 domain-containing protein [Gammaproteobacteria bacterium]|nr:DUF4124 domain-containing protein [Gammaproteobacteria bacterium]
MTSKIADSVRLQNLMLAVLLCAVSSASMAGALYKWVDENGAVRYSDQLPPQQSRKKHQQLNSQGMVLTTREAAKSQEEMAIDAESKRLLEEQQREEARLKSIQDKKDRVLLLTFSTEEELEHARDSRVEVIDSVIRLISSSIDTTQDKLDQLTKRAEDAYISQSKQVPGGLAQKIEHFQRKIESRNAQIALKAEEKEKIRQRYERDLERFRLLKSASN